MREALYVVDVGASTPVGRDAWSSAAAVRGQISGFTQHPYMIDTAGEPMCVALAPWLDIDCEGHQRFEALLFPPSAALGSIPTLDVPLGSHSHSLFRRRGLAATDLDDRLRVYLRRADLPTTTFAVGRRELMYTRRVRQCVQQGIRG